MTEKPTFKHIQVLDEYGQFSDLVVNVSAIELIEGPVETHSALGVMTPNGVTHTLRVSTLTLTSGRRVRVFNVEGSEPIAKTLGIIIG